MEDKYEVNRRNFNKMVLATATSMAILPGCQRRTTKGIAGDPMEILIPAKLKPGNRVALIAPSSYAEEAKIQKAITNLESLGLVVEEGKYLRAENGFIGGTDGERVEEIHNMFHRSDIDGIWCVRGGYGATRILGMLDYDLIRNHPKVFVGYSDITALHQAFFTKAGLVSYHGPVASSDFPEYAVESIKSALFEENPVYEITPATSPMDGEEGYQVLRSGMAQGRLVGGNLTLLASMCGTGFLTDFTGKIVYIEDIGEDSYRVDRMLVQLIQAANLKQAAGLIFGNFTNCDPEEGSSDQTVQEIIRHHFSAIDIPVVTGYSIGHIAQNATLASGMQATLEGDSGMIRCGQVT